MTEIDNKKNANNVIKDSNEIESVIEAKGKGKDGALHSNESVEENQEDN